MPRALGQERAVPRRDQAPWGRVRHAQDDLRSRQNKAAAVKQWGEAACALRARHAKLGEMMDASREDVLAYMDFPREHWPQIASTNPLERLNREIKRRSGRGGHLPERCGRRQADRRVRHGPRTDGGTMADCSRPATNGPSPGATCPWRPWPAWCRLIPSACPPRRPDQPGPSRRPALLHHPAGHYPASTTRRGGQRRRRPPASSGRCPLISAHSASVRLLGYGAVMPA